MYSNLLLIAQFANPDQMCQLVSLQNCYPVSELLVKSLICFKKISVFFTGFYLGPINANSPKNGMVSINGLILKKKRWIFIYICLQNSKIIGEDYSFATKQCNNEKVSVRNENKREKAFIVLIVKLQNLCSSFHWSNDD